MVFSAKTKPTLWFFAISVTLHPQELAGRFFPLSVVEVHSMSGVAALASCPRKTCRTDDSTGHQPRTTALDCEDDPFDHINHDSSQHSDDAFDGPPPGLSTPPSTDAAPVRQLYRIVQRVQRRLVAILAGLVTDYPRTFSRTPAPLGGREKITSRGLFSGRPIGL